MDMPDDKNLNKWLATWSVIHFSLFHITVPLYRYMQYTFDNQTKHSCHFIHSIITNFFCTILELNSSSPCTYLMHKREDFFSKYREYPGILSQLCFEAIWYHYTQNATFDLLHTHGIFQRVKIPRFLGCFFLHRPRTCLVHCLIGAIAPYAPLICFTVAAYLTPHFINTMSPLCCSKLMSDMSSRSPPSPLINK